MTDGQTPPPPPPPPQDPNAGVPPAPQPGTPVPPAGFDPAAQQAAQPVPPAPQPAAPVPPAPQAGTPVPPAPVPGAPVPPPPMPQAGAPVPPPPAGAPAAGQPPANPVGSPLQSDDELDESQFITGGDDHTFIKTVPVPPHPNTQFDEHKFLELLAGSISLTKTEKQRIIASIPKLSQYQIDELIRIFTEEQAKFAELNKKHADQLQQLENKHKNDWDDIANQAQQQEAQKKDDDEAEALRKKLGLGDQ